MNEQNNQPKQAAKIRKHLVVKNDITAEEAAALPVILGLVMAGIKHPLTDAVSLSVSSEELARLFKLTERHWDDMPGTNTVTVDADGKRHFKMNCETGRFGMKLAAAK